MKELELPLATAVNVLVLIGGGEFSFGETKEIDEYVLRRMPHGNKRVAFLPTASGSAEYAGHFGQYLKTIDPEVETINVPIYRGRDSRRQRNLDHILGAGLTYLGGGVVDRVVETLRESAAEIALRDSAAGGAVIAAIGASASCFGTWVTGPLQAMGWLPGVVIETGFDPQSDTNLRRLMSIPEVTLGVGIPPRTALVIQSTGKTEIVGDGKIAVVRKG